MAGGDGVSGAGRMSSTEYANELLFVVANVIDIIRAGLPTKTSPPKRVARSFARAYESQVRAMWKALRPSLPNLAVTFEPQYFDPVGNTTVVVEWHAGGVPEEDEA